MAEDTEYFFCPPPDDADCCDARGPRGYWCTRQKNHGGMHIACGREHDKKKLHYEVLEKWGPEWLTST